MLIGMSSPETHVQIGGLQPAAFRIGFGTYHLMDKMNASTAIDTLGTAFEQGVNLFDTSDNYGTELVIGRAVSAGVIRREDVIIATKTGLGTTLREQQAWDAEGRKYNTDPERVRKQVDNSLLVLGDDVGVIDLYQLHVHDPNVPHEAHAELMSELIDEQKIHAWGISNYSAGALADLLAACDERGLVRPVTSQPFDNMVNIHAADVALAKAEGLTVLTHSPLLKSVLTNKRLQELQAVLDGIHLGGDPKEQEIIDSLRPTAMALEQLAEMAQDRGYTLAQLAIAWTLREPGTATLTTPTNKQYLEESIGASQWHVDPELLAAVNAMRSDERSVSTFSNVSHGLVRRMRGY